MDDCKEEEKWFGVKEKYLIILKGNPPPPNSLYFSSVVCLLDFEMYMYVHIS